MTRSTAPIILAIVILGAFVLMQIRSGGTAPTPAAFVEAASGPASLSQALESAASQNRPVLAIATADWCPPCQTYKKTTLASARVSEAIGTKSVPIILDVTERGGPFAEDAARLGVSVIPATFVLAPDGSVLSQATGPVGEDALIAMLDEAQAALAQN